MSQTPTFFSYGWIMMFWVMQQLVEMEQNPITPSAGVAGVGFDATYDLLVNTDVWRFLPLFFGSYNTAGLSAAQASALNSGYTYNGGLGFKNNGLLQKQSIASEQLPLVAGANGFSNDCEITNLFQPHDYHHLAAASDYIVSGGVALSVHL
jgi:hypothetical protein